VSATGGEPFCATPPSPMVAPPLLVSLLSLFQGDSSLYAPPSHLLGNVVVGPDLSGRLSNG
jgi:hypothetical protein